MKKVLLVVLMILLVSSLMFATGSSQSGAAANQGPTKLRVGVMPYLASLTTKYVIDQGWDVKAGIKLETISFPSGAPMNESMAADLLDVGIMSGAAVTAVAAFDCILVGEMGDSAGGIGLFVRPDSPIAKVKGANPKFPNVYGNAETVKGKQIFVAIGTMSHSNVIKWLDAIGSNVDSVKIANMDFASAYQAFLAGQGDIVALNPPTSYKAEENGWIDVGSMTALSIPLNDTMVVNPKSFNNPKLRDAVEKYMSLLLDANELFRANPKLQEERLLAWYKENGSNVAPADVAKEVKTRLLITREEARTKIKVGASAKQMATFNSSLGTLEASKLPKFDTNVNTELWNRVINKK